MDQTKAAKIDSFAEPDWNVAQAVVWVATRLREWVDDCSDRGKHADREYGFAAVPIIVNRHFGLSTWDNAAEELRGALRAGRITAWGTDQHGSRRRIDPGEWQDLHFQHFERSGPPPVRRLNFEKQLVTGKIEPFQNVRIGRSDLLREWPEREARAIFRTFGQGRWPLHFALAWVLTRDCAFAERAKFSDFCPRLDRDGWISQDEVNCAWPILHQFLADAAFRRSGFPSLAAMDISGKPAKIASRRKHRGLNEWIEQRVFHAAYVSVYFSVFALQ